MDAMSAHGLPSVLSSKRGPRRDQHVACGRRSVHLIHRPRAVSDSAAASLLNRWAIGNVRGASAFDSERGRRDARVRAARARQSGKAGAKNWAPLCAGNPGGQPLHRHLPRRLVSTTEGIAQIRESKEI
uniref:Uncharacterized protein n=1 Tax=Oryza glumipatula TaxID=40148 RepID=A0A0D9YAF1_9ORYZ